MDHNEFFPPHGGVSLRELAAHLGADLLDPSAGDRIIRSVAPVARAVEGQICYIISRKSRDELTTCKASAIICDAALQSVVPEGIAVLVSKMPHAAFAMAGAFLHPIAMRPSPVTSTGGISQAAFIDPTAKLEADVQVEPMAVIGARAEIGSGTRIGAGSVIGAGLNARSNRTPSAARRSRCCVRPRAYPYAPRWSARVVSRVTSRMLSRTGAAAEGDGR